MSSLWEDAHSSLLEFLTLVREEGLIILVDFRGVQWEVHWLYELGDLGFTCGSSSSEMLLSNYWILNKYC